jgi:hypothetical protein
MIVIKLKAKLRLLLKKKCRHPACKAEKTDYPIIKLDYIKVLNLDRIRH